MERFSQKINDLLIIKKSNHTLHNLLPSIIGRLLIMDIFYKYYAKNENKDIIYKVYTERRSVSMNFWKERISRRQLIKSAVAATAAATAVPNLI